MKTKQTLINEENRKNKGRKEENENGTMDGKGIRGNDGNGKIRGRQERKDK